MQLSRQQSGTVKNPSSGFRPFALPLCDLGQVAPPLCAQLVSSVKWAPQVTDFTRLLCELHHSFQSCP